MNSSVGFCGSPAVCAPRTARGPAVSALRGCAWLAPCAPRRATAVQRTATHSTIVAADKALALPKELEKLVDSFASVPDDKLRYQQLLFFAKKLPPMGDCLMTEANLVRGCTSVVYVSVSVDKDGIVHLEGTSDGQLTKGLVALLVNGLKGCTVEEVLAVDPSFIKASGLSVSLTPSRNNGFVNMVAKIKQSLREWLEAENAPLVERNDDDDDDIADRPIYSSMMRKAAKLKPVELSLQDNSAQHAGHSAMRGGNLGSFGESHFKIRVVSDVFEGLPLVKRHQVVYALFADEMKSVHALNIDARTPSEVAAKASK